MSKMTVLYNKTMKMSDLIDADYKLLLLLERLKLRLGFGEKSVDAVCLENGFDTDCFLFLANLQSNRSVLDVEAAFEKLPLAPFIYYLKCSHEYFLDKRLPNIKRKLSFIFSDDEKKLQNLVLNFFDNYMAEVRQHMLYENEVVFPYIQSLLDNSATGEYTISYFEQRHNDIEEKMADLKRILMKYISGIKDQFLMTNILFELYQSEEELEMHTYIEDELVIPSVKKIENQ